MSSRMQEVLPCSSHWQAVHRGHSRVEDRLHLGKIVHRLWYLPEEMSFRRYPHHQPAHEPGDRSHTPILREQLQIAQTPHAQAWPGARSCRDEWHWEEYGAKDPERQAQAQSGEMGQSTGLGGDFEVLQRV